MARTSRYSVLVLLAATLGVIGSAGADTLTVRDAARDGAGAINLRSVSHGHRGAKLVHTLRSYDPWRGRVLGGRYNVINLAFNRQDRGDAKVERVLVVDYQDGHLVSNMIDVIHDRTVGVVQIRRPDLKTLKLIFPKRFLKRHDPGPYRWSVGASADGTDHVPELGRAILHRL